MADLVWGEPVVGGETVPPDSPRGAYLYRINDDGTRRSAIWDPSLPTTGISLRPDATVPDNADGCIPHKILRNDDPFYLSRESGLSDKERDEGRYVGFANAGGACYFGPEATTPAPPSTNSGASSENTRSDTWPSTTPAPFDSLTPSRSALTRYRMN